MYIYPKSYKIKSVNKQKTILKNIFGLEPYLQGQEASQEGEGIFAIPHWKLIAPTYNDAVIRVLEEIKKSRPFYDWRGSNWSEKYLRQLPIKEKFWNETPQEVVLLSAQFGSKYAGKSVKTVRTEMQPNELPLGLYEVSIMALTHPERFQSIDELDVDCPGDEYSWDGDGDFSGSPYLCFYGDKVEANAGDVGDARDGFGSASGFVPQPLETRSVDSFESLTLDSAIKMVKDNGFIIYKQM